MRFLVSITLAAIAAVMWLGAMLAAGALAALVVPHPRRVRG